MDDARAAITNLVLTYAERIDRGDFDGVADLFVDAVVTNPADPTGRRIIRGSHPVTPDDPAYAGRALARALWASARLGASRTAILHWVTAWSSSPFAVSAWAK